MNRSWLVLISLFLYLGCLINASVTCAFIFFPALQNYQEGRWRYLCFLIAKASTHLQTTAKMIKH